MGSQTVAHDSATELTDTRRRWRGNVCKAFSTMAEVQWVFLTRSSVWISLHTFFSELVLFVLSPPVALILKYALILTAVSAGSAQRHGPGFMANDT